MLDIFFLKKSMTQNFLASSITSYKREIKIRYGKCFIVDYFLENMTTIIILNYPLIQCQTFFSQNSPATTMKG